MNFVDEENRLSTVKTTLLVGVFDHRADIGNAGQCRVQLLEPAVGRIGDNARERRLAAPGRSVKDHRRDPICFDRATQLISDGILPGKFFEITRAHAFRQRAKHFRVAVRGSE